MDIVLEGEDSRQLCLESEINPKTRVSCFFHHLLLIGLHCALTCGRARIAKVKALANGEKAFDNIMSHAIDLGQRYSLEKKHRTEAKERAGGPN